MMFHFPGAPKVTRAYSIASSPLEEGYIDIALNEVHAFTARMFSLRRGETLLAHGPYGKWVYEDHIPHAVLISGGTGITPIRGIVRYVLGKGLPNRLTILASARTPADLLYREESAEWSRRPNIRVVHTITRPHLLAPHEKWDGPTGRIDLAMVKAAVPETDFPKAHFYMCGPNQLIEALAGALSADGVPRERIRYEKWGKF